MDDNLLLSSIGSVFQTVDSAKWNAFRENSKKNLWRQVLRNLMHESMQNIQLTARGTCLVECRTKQANWNWISSSYMVDKIKRFRHHRIWLDRPVIRWWNMQLTTSGWQLVGINKLKPIEHEADNRWEPRETWSCQRMGDCVGAWWDWSCQKMGAWWYMKLSTGRSLTWDIKLSIAERSGEAWRCHLVLVWWSIRHLASRSLVRHETTSQLELGETRSCQPVESWWDMKLSASWSLVRHEADV